MENKHTYKLCPECHYFCNTKEENNYCPHCGVELKAECEKCGKPITYPYAKYCGKCGTPYRKETKKNSMKEIK